jgi:excisionase family DNA binding protein
MSGSHTVQQAAELLAVSVDHVGVLIRSGELPASDISRPGSRRPLWRIADEDLAAFLARRRHLAAPKPVRRRKRPSRIVEFV